MDFTQTVLLAAIAGGTIFLGLPVGRLRGLSMKWQAALTTAAGGVILFLIYDILVEAVEPVDEALDTVEGRRIGRRVRAIRGGRRAERGLRVAGAHVRNVASHAAT